MKGSYLIRKYEKMNLSKNAYKNIVVVLRFLKLLRQDFRAKLVLCLR